jgi:hypothetical protein
MHRVTETAYALTGRRRTCDNAAMTQAQLDELKRQLDLSEVLHHKIMAKMSDPKFDLLEAWGRKEKLDAEIGRFIRTAMTSPA